MIAKLRDESGSAIVEFVALAIPLFIPVLIYLNSFASVSGNEAVIRVMAREGVRAYAASDSDYSGRIVSEQAIDKSINRISKNLGIPKSADLNLRVQIVRAYFENKGQGI